MDAVIPAADRPPRLAAPSAPVGDLDLWNRLASWFGQWVPLDGGARGLFEPGEAPPPERPGFLVDLAPGARVVAVPAAAPFEALTGSALAVEDLALLPAVLREALLDGLGGSLLALVPAPAGPPPRLVARGSWPELVAGAADLHWFGVALEGWGGGTGAVHLGAGAEALHRAFGAGGLPRAPRRPLWPGLGGRLTQTLHESLGRIGLPAADLAALAPGSVVVLPAGLDPARTRVLRGERSRFDLVRGDGGWTCAGVGEGAGSPAPRRSERDPTTDDPRACAPSEDAMNDAAPPRPPGALASLPVAVDIDLGRITAPLAEIESWGVGSLVPLDATPAEAGIEVALRVDGRVIAAGDLVRLDDRLGVRLSRIALG